MQKQDEHRDYYSVRIAAEVMGVSRSTVFRYIKSGKLEALAYKGDYYVCQEGLDLYRYRHALPQSVRDEARIILRQLRDDLRENAHEMPPRT